MKTILFVAHSGTLAGGGERSLLEMVLHTSSLKGHKVQVALPFEGEFSLELKKASIEYHVGPIAFSMHPRGDQLSTDTYKWQSVSFSDSLANAFNIILKVKPDLIITNTVVIPWFYKLAHLFAIPNIVCIREMYDERNGVSLAPNTEKYLASLAENVDYILYNSEYTKKSYDKFLSRTPSTVIYPTVNIPQAHINRSLKNIPLSSPIKRILVIGNIAEHKNQLEAIKAVELLVNKFNHEDVQLTIMGSDSNVEYVDTLKDYVSHHSLQRYITFKPFSNNPYDEMLKNDIILMTSHNEAFGRVTLEGQLLGKIVIGAKIGGTLEIIDDKKTGILYKPGDPNDFAKKIDWCLVNSEDSQRIAKLAQKEATQKFSLKNIFKSYDSLLLSNTFNDKKPIYDETRLFGEDIYSLIIRNKYMNEKISEYASSLENQIHENEQLKSKALVKLSTYPKKLYRAARKKIKS